MFSDAVLSNIRLFYFQQLDILENVISYPHTTIASSQGSLNLSPEDIKVRAMQPEDRDEVLPVLTLAVPFAKPQEVRNWISRALRDNPTLCLVAESKGKIVGALCAMKCSSTMGEINDMAVKPGYQGRGIGHLLLEEALMRFQRARVMTVRAVVPYECAASIPFYYKHGFRVSKCSQDYYGPHEDVILLTRRISKASKKKAETLLTS